MSLAPPLSVRWNLWREVRLFGRSRDVSEKWQPFSTTAAVLTTIGLILNAAALFVFFVLGGLWVTGDRHYLRSAEFLCSGLEPGRQADCAGVVDNDIAAAALVGLSWLLSVFSWFLAPLLGLVILIQVSWYIRGAAQRRGAWQESLYWEYVGEGDVARMAVPGRHELVVVGGIGWVRRMLRTLRVRPRRGFGPDRLTHARRWAWARETQSLAGALAGLAGLSISVALILWHYGLTTAAREVEMWEAARILVVDYLWNLAHAIPVLELTETLRWNRPDLFSEDRLWSIVLLVLKILLFVPIVSYVADIVRSRREQDPPRAPYENDPVVRAAFGRILDSPFPLRYFVFAGGWPRLYQACARELDEAGVAAPAGSWTAAAVAAHVLAAVTASPATPTGGPITAS